MEKKKKSQKVSERSPVPLRSGREKKRVNKQIIHYHGERILVWVVVDGLHSCQYRLLGLVVQKRMWPTNALQQLYYH